MATSPNVLLIVVHDLGNRLGCYGYDTVPSPRLDELARDGVRFTSSFCTAPFCSPSRGSIITGEYPHVNGLMGLVNLGWDWDATNRTIARALGEQGYVTYLFGLQHEVREELVEQLGFDWVSDRSQSRKCGTVAPMVERFLLERSAGAKPFYVRVGFSEVHRTFDGYDPEDPDRVMLPGYIGDTKGAREDFAAYDGAIREMDAAVGRILDALERGGHRENTLVIFTTDHGIPFPRAKGTLYDPGIQTALLMRWPNGFPGGQVISPLVSNVDLFPTILEAVGAESPSDIQGRTLQPLLEGKSYIPREYVFAENTAWGNHNRCVRTERFKFIHNYNRGPSLVLPADIEISLTRRDMGNEHLVSRPQFELYDLQNDPDEADNLAGKPERADEELRLSELLASIQEETKDPALSGPIARPAVEDEKLKQAFERVNTRCPYPREGLLCGYEVARSEGCAWIG